MRLSRSHPAERWKHYADVYRFYDPFLQIFARLERDWDDREAWDEFNRLERETGNAAFLTQQRYGPYVALLAPAIMRAAVMYGRAEANRRLTVFGLNLWADALEGKISDEPLPLNPETGKPIIMEQTEDRVTLRTGKKEGENWEAVMTIHLQQMKETKNP